MSSIVPKHKRTLKKERKSIKDFSKKEKELIKKIFSNFGEFIVYGSRVKGDYEDDSDIDIAINNYRRNYHKFIFKMMGDFYGIKIDATSYELALKRKNKIIIYGME